MAPPGWLSKALGVNLTWEAGRRLSTLQKGETSVSYTYNAEGTRIGKTVNGRTKNYLWDGGKLLSQTFANDTQVFLYHGDSRVALEFMGQLYYYVYNLQGDVVGLVDKTGTTMVTYKYDVWGKPESTTGPMATTLGVANPFRYRGYYYDTESGFYYLQSRYYDPEVGRFLNADSYVQTGQGLTGLNMYLYCGNNPVTNQDPLGDCWHRLWIFGDCASCKAKKEAKAQVIDAITQVNTATQAVNSIALGSVYYDLPNGWKARIDPENSGTSTQRHIHVENKGEKYSQNKDGSPHDGSTGSPPKKVKKALKKVANWDWDKKVTSWENSQNPLIIHKCSPSDVANGNCVCSSPFTPYGPNIGPVVDGYPLPAPAPAPSPWGVPIPVG